jgi:copper(I)-binding protein
MKKFIILMTGLLFAGLLATFAAAHGFKVGDIEIGHPHARAMVPGAKVGGGYMKITNNGNADDRLVSVICDRAASAEVHLMSVDAGVMTMRPVSGGLTIPAGKTVDLKPGGYHIMFMSVAQPFKSGEMIKATLTFEKAGAVEVEFAVGNAGGSNEGGDHSDMDHSDMGGMDMSKPQ